jgi:membrane protein YqaA with SNARE-associated domain
MDGIFPMMPAEFMALALMILQPRREILIALVFSISAAVSAGLLAALITGIAQATALPGWLEGERQGAGWAQAVSIIQSWGAPALALAAVFPDSPRASVTVAALAGFAPINITCLVLAGKLLLYGLLALAVRYMPRRWPGLESAAWPGARHLRRAFRRFAALRRWVNRSATAISVDRTRAR